MKGIEIIRNILDKDEKILWEGRPQSNYDNGRVEKTGLAVFIFSLVMLGISLTIIEDFGFLCLTIGFWNSRIRDCTIPSFRY